MGITLAVESFSLLLMHPLHIRNNMPVYNVFSLVETECYAAYFYGLLQSRRVRKIVLVFMTAFPLAWIFTTFFVFGFNSWNSYGVAIESAFCVAMSVRYLYEVITQTELIRMDNNPDFWIVIGVLTFFVVQLPLVGMLNFMKSNLLNMAFGFLLKYAILNLLLYTIFTYAFLCRIITRKSPSS